MEKNNETGVLVRFVHQSNKESDNTSNKKQKNINKFNFVFICFYGFLTGTDFAVIIPTLWDRLSLQYNADGAFLGAVMSAYSVTGVLCGLLLGKLSDDKPNKTKLFYLGAIFFSIAGHILYFIGINKYVILLARAISGLCLGGITVALAYIARTSSMKARTSLISLVMASRQLGLMLGPAFNLFLRKADFTLFNDIKVDKRNSPGLFMGIIWSTLFFLIAVFYRQQKLIPEKTLDQEEKADTSASTELIKKNLETDSAELTASEKISHFIRIEIFVLLLTTLFTYFNQTALETILIPFTEEAFGWNEFHNSILFCIGGLVIVIGYVLIRILTTKLGDRCVLLMGIISILIGLLLGIVLLSSLDLTENKHLNQANNSTNETIVQRSFSSHGITFQVGMTLSFLLDVLGLPGIAICSSSLFTKLVDNKLQGTGQGIQRGVLGVGTILGPLFTGPFIHHAIVVISVCAVMISIIMLSVVVTFRRLIPLKEKTEKKTTAG